jgi:hypothetical protein
MPRCPRCGYNMPIRYVEEYFRRHDCVRCPRRGETYYDLDELEYEE